MKRKSIILLLSIVPILVMAQASGGQIKRNAPKQDRSSVKKVTNTIGYGYTGKENGHEYVDLGLSVKWATCNVGASSPESYGYYFPWGETTPCTNYSDRLLVRNDNKSEITGTRDDAARVRMGGKWRMPTKNEAQELFDRCKWKHTIYKGIWGFCVTGPNSKKIFIPSAGFHARDGLMRGKDGVMLWTSTAYIDHTFDLCLPYHMVIDNKKNSNPPVTLWINAESYDVGMCIRPVVN